MSSMNYVKGNVLNAIDNAQDKKLLIQIHKMETILNVIALLITDALNYVSKTNANKVHINVLNML